MPAYRGNRKPLTTIRNNKHSRHQFRFVDSPELELKWNAALAKSARAARSSSILVCIYNTSLVIYPYAPCGAYTAAPWCFSLWFVVGHPIIIELINRAQLLWFWNTSIGICLRSELHLQVVRSQAGVTWSEHTKYITWYNLSDPLRSGRAHFDA